MSRGLGDVYKRQCITKAVKEKRLERALERPIGEDVLKQLLEDFEHGRQ